MSFKDFDAARTAPESKDFQVAGQRFSARPELSWRVYSSMVDAMVAPDVTEEEGARLFFGTVLRSRDKVRFFELLDTIGDVEDDDDDCADVITNGQVRDLMQWLLESYRGGKVEETPKS